ncbi:MAG: SDR family oxidoreductase [Rhizobacter sp.]|nr:SDR family oxidoreductase [Chlorobiales bacterium]
MNDKRIAIVTGAYRGIGLEVCRQLGIRGYRVVLTSRDESKGKAATEKLKQENIDVIFYPLDVTSHESILNLKHFAETELGRLDVLINNAAVHLDAGINILQDPLENFEASMRANAFGPLLICQVFMPLMLKQKYGRVVNVSSSAGQLSTMTDYAPAYAVSKTALNAVTVLMAHAVGRENNVLINAVCPGWVRTEMGGANAPRSVAEGADTIIWLATLQDDAPQHGGFFRDRKSIAW